MVNTRPTFRHIPAGAESPPRPSSVPFALVVGIALPDLGHPWMSWAALLTGVLVVAVAIYAGGGTILSALA